ncbi:VOC family protein [Zeaxanthinibacter enoshimensis]|uniref:VOC family protein n=1 Tax=Zeaxanthinibacter enoshimensis TaxID=392009 RepID=UPI0035622879
MRLTEVHLQSNDLDATLDFYRGQLGLAVVESKDHMVIRAGETLLRFEETRDPDPVYHFAFEIPHNQVEEAFKWIGDRAEIIPVQPGAPFAEFTSWDARSFYFYDNNGNILECIGRFEQPTRSDHAFNADSLLYLSEMGIVTADVAKLYEEIHKTSGIPLFHKQPPLENFCAAGEESGLLIVVQNGKNWYPTGVPARSFKSRICCTYEGKEYVFSTEFNA